LLKSMTLKCSIRALKKESSFCHLG